MKRLSTAILATLFWIFSLAAWAASETQLPEALQPWVGWVLEAHPEQGCPFSHADETRQCSWPSQLNLRLNAQGGEFSQRWSLFRKEWVTLPGGEGLWPVEVKANGKPVALGAFEGAPALWLAAGEYEISGRFAWPQLPESLPIPLASGLIALNLNGQNVSFPYIDPESGRLWIQRQQQPTGEREEERLSLQVFRRILDELPLQVETRLQLEVSGAQREVLLAHPLLPESLPLRIDSPLPARLEPDGRLRLQVRPGSWTVTLHGRFPSERQQLTAPAATEGWPEGELWVFDARPQLRLVELSGGQPVDPRQTSLPSDWQQLPAYKLAAGEAISFQLQRRGDPVPEPNQLEIERQLWLDFDGGGYTVKDRISGTLTSGWRLQADPSLHLGRAVLDGTPQFITQRQGETGQGVEVRRGSVQLETESRIEKTIASFLATGWQTGFAQVGATLHLPPGWRVFSVQGVDNLPDSWLQRWTLLDLFLVLMAALAIGKLWGWGWSPLALLTLALLWHEPQAPRQVWLHLIAALALLRVLPEQGWFRRLVSGYRWISLAVLLLISLQFIVQQVRTAFYPQLERPWQAAMNDGFMLGGMPEAEVAQPMMAPIPKPLVAPAAPMEEAMPPGRGGKLAKRAMSSLSVASKPAPPLSLDEFDPDAVIQTGPGLPEWQWGKIHLSWNGPVEPGQEVSVIYLSPLQNMLLNLLRILLLLLLSWRLLTQGDLRRLWSRSGQGVAATMMVLGATLVVLTPQPSEAAEFPPAELLTELQQRLLKAPECLPDCADLARLELNATRDRLRLRLQLQAQQRVAVPLPGSQTHWLPELVTVDGGPAVLQRDESGVLWLLLESGPHQVIMEGPLASKSTVQLPLALPARQVASDLAGWRLEGVGQQGDASGQLQLVREQPAADAPQEAWQQGNELPPFVLVQRTLQLGMEWKLTTEVRRLSPSGVAAVLRIPLLAGESITSREPEVKEGQALVKLDAAADSLRWESVLSKSPALQLQAAQQTHWVESWVVEVSPIWHMESEGIPVIHHTDAGRRWHPQWRPWPGESVTLHLTRPQGGEGNSLTIQRSVLELKPGQRVLDAQLELQLQSSQGGRHAITLPESARLQAVRIDGVAQPVRQQERSVNLPLRPGQQQVSLHWLTDQPLESRFVTPQIGLNAPAVNLSLKAMLPSDRWILLVGGPRLGPAVLFWGLFAVVLLGALALSRLPSSPLKHYQWFLLGVGLLHSDLLATVLVVGWLLALHYRSRLTPPSQSWRFNLMQLALGLWTLLALSALFASVEQGLLGQPDMLVAGNDSTAYQLQWYQDRMNGAFPQAWVISLPILVYRLLMLAWAMWLAFSLLHWLRWGWRGFSQGGLWKQGESKGWGWGRKPSIPAEEKPQASD